MKSEALEKFGFLLGSWNLEYIIPKSNFSEARSDTGSGSFKKILTDKYILFEYSTESGGEAKGIFAWDDKTKIYRYWWFENSGSFATATCNFIDDETLAMNWHDTLLVQTFMKESPDKIVLKMKYPSTQGGYDLIMEVILTKK
jgi:hypothetical protein